MNDRVGRVTCTVKHVSRQEVTESSMDGEHHKRARKDRTVQVSARATAKETNGWPTKGEVACVRKAG